MSPRAGNGSMSILSGPTTTVTDRDSAISLTGIAQRLGRVWAVRGVSLAIPAGELVAIVGHNGSGKTTLLRVIATALRPTRGGGTIFGADLIKDANEVRALSAMLTHGAGLYGDLSARENLEFAQRMAGDAPDHAVIDEALTRVGLAEVSDARVRTYSSGMQRRASLARLFLRQPRLLLLDEPYNSLDPRGGALVDDLLVDVRSRGGIGLVVLHDLDRSGVEFDRIIELRGGRVARTDARTRRTQPRRMPAGASA
jgi:heme exporter protein A